MGDQTPLRIIAPESFRRSLSRRALFQIGGAAAGLAIIGAACGSSKKSSGTTAGSTAETTAGTTGATTAGTTGATTAGTTGATTAGTTGATVAAGDKDALLKQYSQVVNKSSGKLSMYTWGDYNDPEIVGALAEKDLGVTMAVDYFDSNEDLISKLTAAGGKGGYDIVVPTGPYIPQMVQNGLLEKFDKSKLPNLVNVDPLYLGQQWDTANDYSVCKDWGSTGYMWDSSQITKDIKTWNDFIEIGGAEAKGNVSLLDTPVNIAGMYFWANGIDWNTTKTEDLDACEKFLVSWAKNVKAFDSYPSTKIAEGSYALSMIWNGDARQAYNRIKDAGGKPEDWKWALGAPATELWMDNYCIAKGSPNPDAAHAWINWLLTPEISIQDLAYHGYNSGMKQIDKLIAALQPDLPHPEMVFFTEAQVKTMHTQKITSAQDRLVEMYNKMKAEAGV